MPRELEVLLYAAMGWLLMSLVASVAFLVRAVRRRTAAGLWRPLLLISGSTAAIGFIGLVIGALRYPESNLLGGFGLAFGPLWGIGATEFVIVLGGWYIARRRRPAGPTSP